LRVWGELIRRGQENVEEKWWMVVEEWRGRGSNVDVGGAHSVGSIKGRSVRRWCRVKVVRMRVANGGPSWHREGREWRNGQCKQSSSNRGEESYPLVRIHSASRVADSIESCSIGGCTEPASCRVVACSVSSGMARVSGGVPWATSVSSDVSCTEAEACRMLSCM
jgi:hypothetical protein